MNNVEKFYDNCVTDEWKRLKRQKTEFYITMKVLEEYLPGPPARILDLGGGPGRYSIELSRQGYIVTLIDISENNISFAKEKFSSLGLILENGIHGDAKKLNELIKDKKFDSALIMGPLYHLIDIEDRKKVVQQLLRILWPNSYVFASFATRGAIIRDIAKNNPKWLSSNYENALKIIYTGEFKNSEHFTNAYFYTPDEILSFMEGEGFITKDLINCEGLVAGMEDKLNELEYDDWKKWGELNYQIRRDRSFFGAAYHLLYVGKKRC